MSDPHIPTDPICNKTSTIDVKIYHVLMSINKYIYNYIFIIEVFIGHEASGTVVQVGPGVKHLKQGKYY
jgi:threonine dehydrogenase-like Zn-dependent dehydrogenase